MTTFLGEMNAENDGRFSIVNKNRYWTLRAQLMKRYYVISDSVDQTLSDVILNTEEIPKLNDTDQGIKCVDIHGREHSVVSHAGSDGVLWEITCRFDTDTGEGAGGGNDPTGEESEPTERAVKTRWYGENEEEQLFFDIVDGTPVTTVVGEFIYVSYPVCRPILEIQRIEFPPFAPLTQLNFANHVNSGEFLGAPRGCALMMPIVTSELTIDSKLYIEVTYTIKFAMRQDPDNPGTFLEDQWLARPLHEGNYCKDDLNNIVRCTDAKGHPVKALLYADGAQITDPQETIDFDDQFLSFHRYPYADFSELEFINLQ